MPKTELLPGVSTPACPPPVVCNAREAMRTARRRAMFRDGLQLALLLAVDNLFIMWHDARAPLLDRQHTLTLLQMMNGAILFHIAVARTMPRWWARRVASTWSRREQERFHRW